MTEQEKRKEVLNKIKTHCKEMGYPIDNMEDKHIEEAISSIAKATASIGISCKQCAELMVGAIKMVEDFYLKGDSNAVSRKI